MRGQASPLTGDEEDSGNRVRLPVIRRAERSSSSRSLLLRRASLIHLFTALGRSSTAPVLILALLAAVAVQSWFQPGSVIASGDNLPLGFLNPDQVLESGRSLWGNSFTPTGGSDYLPVTHTIPALVGKASALLGQGPEVAQRVFLTLVFVGLAPAMFLLLRTLIPEPRMIAGPLVGSVFYAFNPILLFTVPNAVFLAAFLMLPLLSALVVRCAREDRWRYPVLLAGASTGMSYVLANPPMAALVAATTALTAILTVATSADRRTAVRSLARALLLAVPLNLWWITPALMTLSSSPGQTVTPDADPFRWGWTHARASIVNILKLTPVWSWPQPEYFPFARNLERPVFVGLRLVPVLSATASLLVVRGARRRLAAAALLGVGLVLVLLAKGLHPPFAGLNAFLYRHVPGMWLFREPSGKFTLALAAVLGVGLALFVSSLGRGVIRSAVVVGIAGAIVATSYPLWTGSVIPDDRPLLPSAHVRIPSYWTDAAAFINADPGPTLLLPADDYYQMPYRWGFYGADVFASELIEPPVLRLFDPSGNAYLAPDPSAQEVLDQLRRTIREGRWTEASELISALGIKWIVLRRDIEADFPGRSIEDPGELLLGLSGSPEFRLVKTFGELDLFPLVSPPELVWAEAVPTLYADGRSGGTRFRYDAVRFSRVASGPPSVALVAQTQKSAVDPPVIDARFVSPVEYRVSVRGQSRPFLIALNQTFDRGWTLDGAQGAHIRVNGYANGWIVQAPGDVLTIRYGPQRWLDRARFVSALTATALSLAGGWSAVTALRRRRATRSDLDHRPHSKLG